MGDGWTASNIVDAMISMGLSPEVGEATADDPVRIIAAQDPVTGYGFAVIYMAEPSGGGSNFSFLTLIPANNLSDQAAASINARLATATAFIEDGFLWIYAELDTSRPFSRKYFGTQAEFYLADLRLALQLFISSTQMNFTAAKAFRSTMQRQGAENPIFAKLRNEHVGADAAHGRPAPTPMPNPAAETALEPAPVQSFSSEACPRCDGSGKRLFRPCKACYGSGEVRK